MHINFVHVPVPAVLLPARRQFWKQFDLRYHAVHSNLPHMVHRLFELPHWITWIGGVLYDAGYKSLAATDVYAITCSLAGIDRPTAMSAVRQWKGDVYLFSPMTPNLHHAIQVAECVKETHPKAITIFGGVAATPLHEWVIRRDCVDYVIRGRGEYALPKLLDAIRDGTELSAVGNLSYKVNGSIVTNAWSYPAMPVELIPFPKIDLLPSSVGNDLRYIRQVYGLGCPYSCAYCTIQTIGQRSTYFAIERVMSEIRAYRRHFGAYHHLYFGDETFTIDTERTISICDALAREGGITFDCQTRLDYLADERLPKVLADGGCRWIEIGLEVLNQAGQDKFKQHTSMSYLRDRLARLRDAGIGACSFLINGLPGQSLDDMHRSVDTACELLHDDLLHATYFFGVVPYPGSRLYSNPDRYGMHIKHHDWSLYQEDLPPVFEMPGIDPDDVYEVFLNGVSTLAEAMSAKPLLGTYPECSDESQYGSIWDGPHN